MPHKLSTRSRRGATMILVALLLIPMVALLAFAIDIGYLMMAQSQLQSSADAAALAACWELIDDRALAGASSANSSLTASNARVKAAEYAAYNAVCTQSPSVNTNGSNNPTGDIVVGYLANLTDPNTPLVLDAAALNNAVSVKVRRDTTLNGQVPFFFARALNMLGVSSQATSTAALVYGNIKGFKSPGDGSNLELLPFALDQQTWDTLMSGSGSDNWRYTSPTNNEGCGSGGNGVSAGSDGIREVNLFPQGTGSPGNRGTVDIGSNNNSTADLARQIVSGISPCDLAYHGGSLQFNASGQLSLNGDTGISAGVKDELASIIGKPRVIPIFSSVSGPGNNATYTIVKFVGVRIMEVKLTGSMSSKRVMIQPASVIGKGVIPGGTQGTSSFVYSPVRLVR